MTISTIEISDLLATVAIFISIYTARRTDNISKDITNKTFKKEYFDEIFREFMLHTFPEKIMDKIKWKDGNINEEIYEIEDIIMSFLKKANVYKYIDLNFFQEVYCILGAIEECIIDLIDIREAEVQSQEKYDEIRTRIDGLADQLYKEFQKQYEC